MPVIIPYEQAPQGSEAWRKLRLGIPTASRFSDILTSKGKESKSRGAYLKELARERITGMVANTFESSAMKRGKIMEPESRLHFENVYGVEVEQVAFVYQDERRRVGCSPDGLIGDMEGFETKDGDPYLQRERLKTNKFMMEHFQQVQGSLYICDREVWHFRSYCRGMRPLDIEVHRDEKWIKELRFALEIFCEDLDKEVEDLKNA